VFASYHRKKSRRAVNLSYVTDRIYYLKELSIIKHMHACGFGRISKNILRNSPILHLIACEFQEAKLSTATQVY
jgi:hypothetical protein